MRDLFVVVSESLLGLRALFARRAEDVSFPDAVDDDPPTPLRLTAWPKWKPLGGYKCGCS